MTDDRLENGRNPLTTSKLATAGSQQESPAAWNESDSALTALGGSGRRQGSGDTPPDLHLMFELEESDCRRLRFPSPALEADYVVFVRVNILHPAITAALACVVGLFIAIFPRYVGPERTISIVASAANGVLAVVLAALWRWSQPPSHSRPIATALTSASAMERWCLAVNALWMICQTVIAFQRTLYLCQSELWAPLRDPSTCDIISPSIDAIATMFIIAPRTTHVVGFFIFSLITRVVFRLAFNGGHIFFVADGYFVFGLIYVIPILHMKEYLSRQRFVALHRLRQKIRYTLAIRDDVNQMLGALLPATVVQRLSVRRSSAEGGGAMLAAAAKAGIVDERTAAVLFSDIAGFTAWSSKHSADGVVSMLNAMYRRFDGGLESYGVEKVTTIGDAYWAAVGMPTEIDNPAHRAVAFATFMQKQMLTLRQRHDHADVRIRIGVHCGLVTGALVGGRQMSYQLFGPVTSGAQHHEEHAPVNGILVSIDMKDLLEQEEAAVAPTASDEAALPRRIPPLQQAPTVSVVSAINTGSTTATGSPRCRAFQLDDGHTTEVDSQPAFVVVSCSWRPSGFVDLPDDDASEVGSSRSSQRRSTVAASDVGLRGAISSSDGTASGGGAAFERLRDVLLVGLRPSGREDDEDGGGQPPRQGTNPTAVVDTATGKPTTERPAAASSGVAPPVVLLTLPEEDAPPMWEVERRHRYIRLDFLDEALENAYVCFSATQFRFRARATVFCLVCFFVALLATVASERAVRQSVVFVLLGVAVVLGLIIVTVGAVRLPTAVTFVVYWFCQLLVYVAFGRSRPSVIVANGIYLSLVFSLTSTALSAPPGMGWATATIVTGTVIFVPFYVLVKLMAPQLITVVEVVTRILPHLAVWCVTFQRAELWQRQLFLDNHRAKEAEVAADAESGHVTSILACTMPDFVLASVVDYLRAMRVAQLIGGGRGGRRDSLPSDPRGHEDPSGTFVDGALRRGGAPPVPMPRMIAHQFGLLAVMFCKLGVSSTKVSDCIHAISIYDEELEKERGHCLKVKTIGDSLLAAAGMESWFDGTSRRLVVPSDPATLLQNFTRLIEVAIRITVRFSQPLVDAAKPSATEGIVSPPASSCCYAGVHCGPVVGGVIGQDRLIYDIFGDTVNTASRVTSTAVEPGIWLSEAFYRFVVAESKTGWPLSSRQSVVGPFKRDMKGKGTLDVYRVIELPKETEPNPRDTSEGGNVAPAANF